MQGKIMKQSQNPIMTLQSFFYSICGLLLLVVMTLQLAACLPPSSRAIDSTDPLENAGSYSWQTLTLQFDNPEVVGQPMTTTLYLPQLSEMEAIPLMILLPGFGARHSDYRAYSVHLASHGVAVLGFTPKSNSGNIFDSQHDYQARQISYVLDALLAGAGVAGAIDTNRIGIIGHSLGGKLAFYAAALDSRFRLVAALDPVNSGGAPCAIDPNWCSTYPVAPNPLRDQDGMLNEVASAVLIFRSAPDLFNPDVEFNAVHFFTGSDGNGLNAVAAPALYINMGSVPHAAYVPGPLAGLNAAFVKRTVLAWINRHFYQQDVTEYITGARMQASIDMGLLESVAERTE